MIFVGIIAGINSFFRAHRRWTTGWAAVVLSCGMMCNAQTLLPAQIGTASDAVSIDDSSATNINTSSEQKGSGASQAVQPGTIMGTVVDQTGSVAVGAPVHLTCQDKSFSQEVTSGDNGQFSFSHVPPGHFKLSVTAPGFGDKQFSGELTSGQTYIVPSIVIQVATVVTDVKVSLSPVEVATEEVKEEEHQRVFGIIPNFYVVYQQDPAPLTTKLKFHLAWKSSTDPVTFAGAAFLAGLEQAGDQYPEFGQGAEGYGKRLGAGYADIFASTFLSGAVFPSLLRQDPRYYYRGTGSTKSRLLHAVGNAVICKGDNGRWQINYSNVAGSFAGAALSSTFYPTKNPGMFTLSSGFVRLGESSLAGFMQEFVVRKLGKTRRSDVQ